MTRVRILRFDVPLSESATVHALPQSAKILDVGVRARGTVTFWAEVDPNAEKDDRTFIVYGTGDYIPEGWDHVGTTVDGQAWVWHLYELRAQ